MLHRRFARCLPLATTLLAVAALTGLEVTTAPTASAAPSGTIVYLAHYNVWLINADGSGRYQVTTDGSYQSPYTSPSMADDGTIAVGHGRLIVRMKQNGTVLNTLDPLPMTNSAGYPQDGPPVDVAISPDGSRIAYTTSSYTCPVAAECAFRQVTGVTAAGALTPPVMKSYFQHPSWVTNRRLMVHGGYLSQVMLQDSTGSAGHWFDDSDLNPSNSTDLTDGEVSRDGRHLALLRGFGADTNIVWYAVSGDVHTADPAALPNPQQFCQTGTSDEAYAQPTWSPDATGLAFSGSEGLTVVSNPAACEGSVFTVVDAAGSSPSWSPAANNPGPRRTPTPPPAPPPPPTPPPTTHPPTTGHPPTTTQPAAVFTLKARPHIRGHVHTGRRVRATAGKWSPAPSATRYRWLRDGKAVHGSRGGHRVYRIRRHDRGHRLAVRVTVRRAGVHPARATSRTSKVR